MRCQSDQQSISDPSAESYFLDNFPMPQPPTTRDVVKQSFIPGRRSEKRVLPEGGSFRRHNILDSFKTAADQSSTSSLLTNEEPNKSDDVSLQAAENVSGALFEMWIPDHALSKCGAFLEILCEILLLNIDRRLIGVTLIVIPVVNRHLDHPQFMHMCFQVKSMYPLGQPDKNLHFVWSILRTG